MNKMEHTGAKPGPLNENVSTQFIMSNTAQISQQLKKDRKKRNQVLASLSLVT